MDGQALVQALESVANNLRRHEALIDEARSKKEQLAIEADEQLLALQQARQQLQELEESRAAMAANLKNAEEARARAQESSSTLKQEIQRLQDEIGALAQQEEQEKEAFIATCAGLLEQSKSLVAECERAVSGIAGPPAPPPPEQQPLAQS